MGKTKFKPNVCPCCEMTTEYTVSLDKGTAELLKAMIRVVSTQNRNEVYLQQEVKNGVITAIMAGNLTKARAHGLIAPVKNKKAQYLITRKGAEFLRGKTVPTQAIVSKKDNCQIGYFLPEIYKTNIVKITNSDADYWEFLDQEYPQKDSQDTLGI